MVQEKNSILKIACYYIKRVIKVSIMAEALQNTLMSFQDYLTGERDIDVRSEYIDGQIYAMAGASETHNTIASELHTLMNSHVPDECRVWQSDMKVMGETQGDYFSYYPDVMASCEKNTGDLYIRTNPCLIVEVLSPSTQRTDLKEKFDNYIQIPSLLEYLVVSFDTPYIRIFRRNNNWQLESYYAKNSFILESINIEITVESIYRRVKREVGLII